MAGLSAVPTVSRRMDPTPGSAASWLAPVPGTVHYHLESHKSLSIIIRFAIKDFDKPYKWYNAIMALRVLWLKSNAPDTWRLLDMLMDHAEVTDREDKMINGVVDFILNVCKLNFTGGKEGLSSRNNISF